MKRLSFAMILLTACGSSEPAETDEPTAETDSGGEAEADDAEHAANAEGGPTHGRHQHGHHGQGHDHDFSDVERFAAIFDDPERDEWQKPDEVVALMALEPGQTVADLGAGTGYFLSRLSNAVGPEGRVLGLDVEPNMVAHMEERIAHESLANVEARVVPTDDPGLEPASVDAILIVDTWHHIGEREVYSEKLFAALKPGGAVFVVDFTREAPHGPPAEMRLSPLTVAEELSSAGFEIGTLEETLPHQYMVQATKPAE
jgi:predicted methyltransferase